VFRGVIYGVDINEYGIMIKIMRNLSGSLVLFTQLWDEGGTTKGEGRNKGVCPCKGK